MHVIFALASIVGLATKLLLRAHHGPPRRPWERQLTAVTAGLTVITVLFFLLDAEVLAGISTADAPHEAHPISGAPAAVVTSVGTER